LLRSLQEIQPDFVEEAKACAGLWSQGKKKQKKKNLPPRGTTNLKIYLAIQPSHHPPVYSTSWLSIYLLTYAPI
jgi:hypothetical protein